MQHRASKTGTWSRLWNAKLLYQVGKESDLIEMVLLVDEGRRNGQESERGN